MNIKKVLEETTKKYPTKIAFKDINEDGVYYSKTYEEVLRDVNELGTSLINLGLKGKKIAIIGRNRYEWAISFLAVTSGVGKAVPLDRMLTNKEITTCLNRIEADAIIYSKEFENNLKEISEDINVPRKICMDKNDDFLNIPNLISMGEIMISSNDHSFINATVFDDSVASYLFTSGTTANSKIVMLSHSNIVSDALNARKILHIYPDDIFFSVLPIHHALENTCGLITPLTVGSTIVYNDSLKNITKNMQLTNPSIIIVVPRILETFKSRIQKSIENEGKNKQVAFLSSITNFIGNDNLRKKVFKKINQVFGGNLRLAIVGGAKVEPDTCKFMRTIGIPVVQGYGLTECSPMVAVNSSENFRDDAVGVAIPETEVKVFNPDQEGVGELIVKGPQVMLGYYQDQKATDEVLKNGYLHTGDLGYIDAKGFIRLRGRSKNVIITDNGKNIYPEEIESLIDQSEVVKESLVYSKKLDNGREILAAEVVVEDEVLKRIKEYPELKNEILQVVNDYLKSVNEVLPEYKRVHDVELREEEFPKTTTMKIKRFLSNIKGS